MRSLRRWVARIFRINSVTVGILLISSVFVLYVLEPPVFRRLELLLADMRFLARGTRKPGPEVVIAAIDEKSIDQIGRWPWPYTVQAKLVKRLVSYRARVIGYDVVFSSSDTSAGIEKLREIRAQLDAGGRSASPDLAQFLDRAIAGADHDRIFAGAIKKSRRTILGYFFHFNRKDIAHLSESQMRMHLENIRNSKYHAIKKAPGARLRQIPLPRAEAVESSIPLLSRAARGSGFFSLKPDADGTIRRYPLIVKYRDLVEVPGEQDYLFPPLALRVLERYLRGTTLFWIDALGVEKAAISGRKKILIPANARGEMLINYLGPGGTFPQYSIVDIIEGRKDRAPPSAFRRKIVLVGAVALGLADLRVTPFDRVSPGVEIHATVIDNMLRGEFLSEPWWSNLYTVGSILFIGLLVIFFLPRLGALWGGIAAAAATAGVLSLNYYLFLQKGWWLSAFYPFFTGVVLYSGITLYRYMVEESQRRFIQQAFSTYLSPRVVTEIVKNPALLKLGGERREITAFFSDVAGFTSVSESMQPEELVQLLNEYLSDMTDIILRYDGTVDKFEGDAIVAFFGAPHLMEDHAVRACLVSLDMQAHMTRLRSEWREKGQKELFMRIGLNTGSAVVGNMGSRTRMDYTMMGDTVNTAARFEGANKVYGTQTLIGEQTYQETKHAVECRELDLITVVGKTHPVPIYELLSRKGELGEIKRRVLDLYAEGMAYYRNREWDKALSLFGEASGLDPNDGPSISMFKRSEAYIFEPPPKSWDGAYRATSK